MKAITVKKEKDGRFERMRQIKEEIIALRQSPLYEYRVANGYKPVIGQGSHTANVMFIGEAPGKNEAETGVPFCGRAGKFLDELLTSVNIPREDVYITNIVKDRPPENRDPTILEIELYAPFLDRQIEIIKPSMIATLGRFSMEYVMSRYGLSESLEPIGRIHGRVFEAKFSFDSVVILPLYHPAVALYNGSNREILFEDFKKVKSYYEKKEKK